MTIIGYARAVKSSDIEAQHTLLEAAGCEKIFTDKAGQRNARPEWDKLLEYIRTGDTIVVIELFRMIRSPSHLFKLAKILDSRDINIISLQDEINTGEKDKCFFNVVKALSKLEKDLKAEGIENKDGIKPRGRAGGRPALSQEVLASAGIFFRTSGKTADEVAKTFNISRRILFKYLKENESPEKEGNSSS